MANKFKKYEIEALETIRDRLVYCIFTGPRVYKYLDTIYKMYVIAVVDDNTTEDEKANVIDVVEQVYKLDDNVEIVLMEVSEFYKQFTADNKLMDWFRAKHVNIWWRGKKSPRF